MFAIEAPLIAVGEMGSTVELNDGMRYIVRAEQLKLDFVQCWDWKVRGNVSLIAWLLVVWLLCGTSALSREQPSTIHNRSGLRLLVASENNQPNLRILLPGSACRIPAAQCRIERGNYLVDVLSAGIAEPFWYYEIQRKASDQIIDLVKFDNYEQALEAAAEMPAKMNEAVAAK